MEITSIATPAMWLAFTGLVLGMLALDLGVFHRHAHEVRPREAATWTVVWITLALAFNGWLAASFGAQRGLEFLTGYLIEKALAVDNIFIFLVVFSTFKVPAAYQHRVLFWGILGALVMRALFIFAGAALLARFHWIIYLFGAFLLLTGFKLLWQRDVEPHPEHNPLFRWFTRLVPSVPEYHGGRFTVRRDGRRFVTPLLLVLVLIEVTDLVFAIDSIPAIFAVTRDPFIVYTSNIFAILGLRAMFFLLAGAMDRFHYLKVGLSFVLMFVGGKMVLADLYKLPISVSLGVIAGILATAIAGSLLRERTGSAAANTTA
ncbi:TerC family protein [bacterium]|nr:TerC family protein [bacterium]